jgi:hypothetical protein
LARPLKTGLEYFPHDVCMSEDIKVKKLEARFGLTGYAIYNKLLETIYKYKGAFNLQDEEDLHLFASTWKITAEQLREIINYCIKVKLFTDENLSSKGISERINAIDQLREKKRSYYKKDEVKCEVLDIQNNSFESKNSSKITQSKGKENKEKKSRGEEAPPRDLLKISFDEFNKAFIAERDFNVYEKYDLEIYFLQAVEKYPTELSIAEIIKRVKKFIACDVNSNGKFSPHLKKIAKKDSVTVAYELVHNNLDWIKNLPDKNPDEVVPQLVQKCRDPARNDTLFEAYVEKALRYYLPAIHN